MGDASTLAGSASVNRRFHFRFAVPARDPLIATTGTSMTFHRGRGRRCSFERGNRDRDELRFALRAEHRSSDRCFGSNVGCFHQSRGATLCDDIRASRCRDEESCDGECYVFFHIQFFLLFWRIHFAFLNRLRPHANNHSTIACSGFLFFCRNSSPALLENLCGRSGLRPGADYNDALLLLRKMTWCRVASAKKFEVRKSDQL